MSGPYDDMIDLPHHEPRNHPRMPRRNRAAQFAPFAALSGYEDAVAEAGRWTDARSDFSEDSHELLDRRLAELLAAGASPLVEVTYFKPDERKAGGACLVARAPLKRIDAVTGTLVLEGGLAIPLADVVDLREAS